MEIAKRDIEKADMELKEMELRRIEEDKRSAYLESLRRNRDFQHYVIDEIFQKEIDLMFSTDSIPNGDYEEMGKALFAIKATKTAIQKMIKPLKG